MEAAVSDEGWVTDRRALETIEALKEFRPGDEIIFQPNVAPTRSAHYGGVDGQVYKLLAPLDGIETGRIGTPCHWTEDGTNIVGIVVMGTRNWIALGNIKAWRRPK